MATYISSTNDNRCHIVLVPGFGGFDALGQVEYYAGITRLFHDRKKQLPPAVLHYFDNLPTAAVETRATRLRKYLAKRIARGEIMPNDKIVLVGHSTGALDIRRLICDLDEDRSVYVDGGWRVNARTIRECLHGVVFLSAPHWGTNIADWVRAHASLRQLVVADLRAAIAGSQVPLLDELEAAVTGDAAHLTGAELILAFRDALTEANDHCGKLGPSRTAEAQEAASELALYFRWMSTDFHAINDLTAEPYVCRNRGGSKSPAHFNEEERARELSLWEDPPIHVLSYATAGGRPSQFPSGCPAPVFELANPFTYPPIVACGERSRHTDFIYRLCYRACAGGPFRWPKNTGTIARVVGPAPPEPLELWDNDGIVNTISMLWPQGEIALVLADHLDIVGHFHLVQAKTEHAGVPLPRTYQSYDSLKSAPRFSPKTFKEVWTEIFAFSCGAGS